MLWLTNPKQNYIATCFILYTSDTAVTFFLNIFIATPIRFSALPEVARNRFIEAGCPIILHCEISESAAQVSWFKDGVPLLQETGLDIKSHGTMRSLIIQSAELKHSGVYSCEAADDHIAFRVDVAGDFESKYILKTTNPNNASSTKCFVLI